MVLSTLSLACDNTPTQKELGESDDAAECEDGEEGCDCLPDKVCDDGLDCRSGRCVNLMADDNESADDESEPASSDAPSGNDDAPSGDDDVPPADDDVPPADDDMPADDDVPPADDDMPADDDVPPADDDVPPADDDVPPVDDSNTTVSRHGQLSVSGTQLVDASGVAVQLKGVSSMWLNWDDVHYAENIDGLRYMRDNWNLQIIRAAMGVDADGAYLVDSAKAKQQVRTIVDNAIAAGVYVLIDWHDHEGEMHQADAIAFFSEMAQAYGNTPNVLYEIYNEPLDVDWATTLKPYHQAVSSAIRQYDPDNVIIMGTPNWSQDVDIAAGNPVAGSNLMYTLHFYACTHTAALRAKAETAYTSGLPIFVTEWGATHADGGVDGIVCEAEAQAWHDWMDQRKISWTAWKLDGCTDSSCFFRDKTAPANGGWGADVLNGHAPFVIERMQSGAEVPVDDPGTGGSGSGGSGSGGTGSGGSGPVESCVPSGMCSSGGGVDCIDGVETPRDCSGCALLSCGVSCCSGLGYFGAETYPTYVERPDLVTSFTQSSAGAFLLMSFDGPNQTGAISFALDTLYPIDPLSVALMVNAVGDGLLAGAVTVSLEDGAAGCQYDAFVDIDGYSILDELPTSCWGDAVAGDPVRQINVRIDSLSAGSGQLSVSSISW